MECLVWSKTEKLDTTDILYFFQEYLASREYKQLKMYDDYYDSDNTELLKKVADRKKRNKTPNNKVPSGYYGTLVDTMSGYMFQNVQYTTETGQDESYVEQLNEVLKDNKADVKDMLSGIYALIYNKAIELVYTVGDGQNSAEVKYTTFDPKNWIILWTADIEPEIYCAIRFYDSKMFNKDYDYYLDVIYADEWQYYKMKDKKIELRETPRKLYFEECPVCCYRTKLVSIKSCFDKIIPYIDALDFILTGNSNEIDRLVDALLVLGKVIKDEDLKHMEEWKVLQNMKTEDRAEYITKEMSPEFREYVSKLLINEIHKHSHVIDWYSPDVGLTGEVSAKALKTRLFDMDMFSQKIEKIYKESVYKRIRLINQVLKIKGIKVGDEVKVIFNRTLPSDVEEKAAALQNVTWISDQTKCELTGLDWETEKERKTEEAKLPYKQLNFGTNTENEETEEEDTEE